MRGAIHHAAISVRDLAASEVFFRPLLTHLGFALKPDASAGEGAVGQVWYNTAANSEIALMQATIATHHHTKGEVGFHHLAFAASSRAEVDDAHRIMRKAGATVLDAPAEYNYTPGYYAVFFACPDGMKFEVVHAPGQDEA